MSVISDFFANITKFIFPSIQYVEVLVNYLFFSTWKFFII